jgi:hypothetical protein
VPICVEYAMMVEDMASGDQAAKEVFKADFVAFGKVTSGHDVCVGLKKTW